jgi:hypothetical protein
VTPNIIEDYVRIGDTRRKPMHFRASQLGCQPAG